MHNFTVDVEWKEGLQGSATPRGVSQEVPFSVPAAFGGPGGEWTPEHFYAAAINACVMATFLSIAQNSKIAVASYKSAVTASMEQTPDGLRMTRAELKPVIVVKSEGDRDRALRMIEKAEKMCPISNSVRSPVALSAVVDVEG